MSAYVRQGDLLLRRWPPHLSEVTVHKVIDGRVVPRPGIHCAICACTLEAASNADKARALKAHRRCRFQDPRPGARLVTSTGVVSPDAAPWKYPS